MGQHADEVHRVLRFFFNDTATTEIYTLSLHDALPIYEGQIPSWADDIIMADPSFVTLIDRKSTRLNSSHRCISYAVFCLKKKYYWAGSRAVRCRPWPAAMTPVRAGQR